MDDIVSESPKDEGLVKRVELCATVDMNIMNSNEAAHENETTLVVPSCHGRR